MLDFHAIIISFNRSNLKAGIFVKFFGTSPQRLMILKGFKGSRVQGFEWNALAWIIHEIRFVFEHGGEGEAVYPHTANPH